MDARLSIAVVLLLLAGAARADGVTGYLEGEYAHTTTRTTDEAGVNETTTADQITQRYRLTLDRGLAPALRFSGGGIFEQINSWATGVGAGDSRNRTTSAFGNLTLGGTVLTGAAGYNYRVEQALGQNTSLVLEEPSLALTWRPTALPTFSVRVARTHVYDTARESEDLATLVALFTSTYAPIPHLSLQYSRSYTNPHDAIHSTDTVSLTQQGRADYSRNTVDGKASVAAGVNLLDRRSEVASAGPGGTTSLQQSPIAGLSLVAAFPAVSSLDTLLPNPALIDGNTTASANLDLGSSVTAANDVNPRELGAQFSDALTQVNTVYVWVDRKLTGNVAASFRWTAWQSDDNVRWQEVPVIGQAVFDLFQNRFEITLPVTAARYLKVVTKPLDPAVTIDRRFANIFVTELQLLLVTPVTSSSGWRRDTRTMFNASARTQLWRPDLSYDVGGFFTHATATGARALDTWTLINGLSWSRKLNPFLLATARVARQDQDQTRGHEGSFLYSASLAATPLPTLSHSAVYSGQSAWTATGFTNTNSVALYNRATPYRGIGLLAGGGWSVLVQPTGAVQRSTVLTLNASVQPNPKLTLSGTFGHTDTLSTGGGAARSAAAINRIDAGVTFTPVPVLYVAAGISHIINTGVPHTLANGTASFSPFPGGDLQFGATYSETYQDPGVISRIFAPSVRWNIRAGTLLTVSYTTLDTNAQPGGAHTRTFDVNFATTL